MAHQSGAAYFCRMTTRLLLLGAGRSASSLIQYLLRHAPTEHWFLTVADANPESDLARLLPQFKLWYSQSGTPRLRARGHHDATARTYTLEVEQLLDQPMCKAAGGTLPEPWVVPLSLGLLAGDGTALPLRLQDEAGGPGDLGDAAAAPTERLIVLSAARQTLTFVGIDAAPVPSLLRGFSAPVVLDDGLDDGALLTLLRHDSDAFNRWEAGQRLMLRQIVAAVRDGGAAQLDDPFIDAARALLEDVRLDPAFQELVLTLPSAPYIAEQLEVVDPQRIHAVRESMRLQLAQSLRASWEAAFERNQPAGGYSPTAGPAGQRALANLALTMLCLDAAERGDPLWPGRAYQRFKDAAHMSDRIGALAALVHSHAPLADEALARFHALFRDEALVIDKWFTLQATAPERDGRVFARAQALMQHPDFTLANPNRARSLIAALCSNASAFHRADAAGYAFWADRVLELDGLNPQLAARLARVLDRWTQLAEPYRQAARDALARVAAKPTLSNDVREIVSRALET